MAGDKQLLLAAQRRAKTDDPSEEDIFAIGTVGHIIQLLRFPKGPVKVLVEGRARARIRGFAAERAVLRVRRRGRRGARRGRAPRSRR